jgi:hypothetical protein
MGLAKDGGSNMSYRAPAVSGVIRNLGPGSDGLFSLSSRDIFSVAESRIEPTAIRFNASIAPVGP